jgi:retron-type reverse transcriptase
MTSKTVRCPNPDCKAGYVYEGDIKRFCRTCNGHKYLFIEEENKEGK